MCVNYARPHIPVIPDFPSDIPAGCWNFVYLAGESLCMGFVKHMRNAGSSSKGGGGWRGVVVVGLLASCNKPDQLARIM